MNARSGAPRPASKALSPGALLAVICLAQFMVLLDVSIVNVALPSIQHDLAFTTDSLQWVVNIYTIAFGGLLMLGGRTSLPASPEMHRVATPAG